ncbi:DnaD domain protein [Staphylococcus pseudintermedius]|uniref:DnaD domain protein n=1 Tax=Staphylococcus pseudintermedius TaxID=283734 RepID=UPI00101E94BB|nr:DnaD domain protein [Staphylococcus pseudintermedius]EGQ4218252.1 DnaD domain protein [Staphylococcus pseudintermedius]EIK0257136.1 DnaD domain protein [Staphylococcus pseudintermedius]EKC6428374.1 DnaD domain protein [Staphylococcus pseudintermedius]RYS04849.1 DnaD domain protein [Staphylococcus pseudintermedius]HDK5706427.1 DnaD domain protein [Staphylococcus pseudintermedius]
MNKLLIDDYPIQVLPKLAETIGLNEAIILQQIHYWLNNSNHQYDDKKWIYNSYPEWQKQFPFWSLMTIKRSIYSLEKQELLIVGNYNKAKFDKTKWYSINYYTLESMIRPSYQNDTTSVSKRNDGTYQNDTTNTIDYTETNEQKETDDVSRIFQLISKEIGMIQNPLKAQELEQAIESFESNKMEIVQVAIDYCKQNNKGINYLIKVLDNWSKEGIKAKEEATKKIEPKKTKKTNDFLEQKRQELFGG